MIWLLTNYQTLSHTTPPYSSSPFHAAFLLVLFVKSANLLLALGIYTYFFLGLTCSSSLLNRPIWAIIQNLAQICLPGPSKGNKNSPLPQAILILCIPYQHVTHFVFVYLFIVWLYPLEYKLHEKWDLVCLIHHSIPSAQNRIWPTWPIDEPEDRVVGSKPHAGGKRPGAYWFLS